MTTDREPADRSKGPMRWRRRVVAGGTTVAALTLAHTSPVFATNDLPANPDNTDHYIGHEAGGWDANGDAAEDQGGAELNRSDLTVHYGSLSDVRQIEGNFSQSTWYGRAYCQDTFQSTCDHFTVQYDSRLINSDYYGSDRTAAYKSLGCHELGHTGGVDEEYSLGYNTCMVAYLDNTKQTLRPHDIDIINGDV